VNDLKAAERRRTILVQVGLLCIVVAGKDDTAGGGARSIRAAMSSRKRL
jgi:hypothetical protein